VAVMGSVLSIRYRGVLGSAVDVLPPDLRTAAGDSLGGTLGALKAAAVRPDQLAGLRSYGPALVTKAQDAYLSAMHSTVLVATGLLAVAVAMALIWLPGRSPEAPTTAEAADAGALADIP
jgi:hypothetical protein